MLSQGKVFDDRDERLFLADKLFLLSWMTDTGRLGFALQLKFRQVQGHYPDSVHDFPSGSVHTIAERVGCTSVSPGNYPFRGRQAQRHQQHNNVRWSTYWLNSRTLLRFSCSSVMMSKQATSLLPASRRLSSTSDGWWQHRRNRVISVSTCSGSMSSPAKSSRSRAYGHKASSLRRMR